MKLRLLPNYFTFIWRFIWKDRLATSLNLIGLSTALTSALCIYFWVRSELQRDRIFELDDQIYQVINHVKQHDGSIRTLEWTPALLADALMQELPEVDRAVTVLKSGSVSKGVLVTASNALRAAEWYVSDGFFTVFPYPFVEGNPDDALKGINRIVISDKLAFRLFGQQNNLVGRQVSWYKNGSETSCVISGIYRHPGGKISEEFDVLIPFSAYTREYPELNDWKNNEPSTYALLRQNTKEGDFRNKIAGFLASKNGDASQSLDIRRYADKYLYGTYENGKSVGGRIAYVRLFSLIGMLILIIACVNFMNLATARSSATIKQVGVRKLMGASRWNLIGMVLSEAGMVTCLATCCSAVILAFALPMLSDLTGGKLIFYPDLPSVFFLFGMNLLVALIAGSYPALYFSRLLPKIAMKGILPTSFSRIMFRKVLVSFQLCMSMLMVVAVVVVYKQMRFIQSDNLGIDREQVLLIRAEGALKDQTAAFMNEIKGIPNVERASGFNGSLTVNVTSTGGVEWPAKTDDSEVTFKYLFVDKNFTQTLGIKLLKQLPFPVNFQPEQAILVNNAAAKAMALTDPVGAHIRVWGEDKVIVGVTEDFHYESFYENVKPCLLIITSEVDNIAVKLSSADMGSVVNDIQEVYHSYNAELPFEFQFLDAQYDALYTSEKQVMVLGRYFAILAVVISMLGLFGLMAFSLQLKRKEIGIRKVIGASALHIVRLMINEFALIGAVSIAVALPVSWLVANSWLNNFAYRISADVADYALLCLSVSIITIGVIALQVLLSTRSNIMEDLKE
ncbi:ABC transporter permease [Parapedobacter sp. GCM10030251]|uniref:ABC transporter permease n=1 Tax=Parapedobacter sp. GCM10030251 TaxID=3273419 RepID=UPI00361876EE